MEEEITWSVWLCVLLVTRYIISRRGPINMSFCWFIVGRHVRVFNTSLNTLSVGKGAPIVFCGCFPFLALTLLGSLARIGGVKALSCLLARCLSGCQSTLAIPAGHWPNSQTQQVKRLARRGVKLTSRPLWSEERTRSKTTARKQNVGQLVWVTLKYGALYSDLLSLLFRQPRTIWGHGGSYEVITLWLTPPRPQSPVFNRIYCCYTSCAFVQKIWNVRLHRVYRPELLSAVELLKWKTNQVKPHTFRRRDCDQWVSEKLQVGRL